MLQNSKIKFLATWSVDPKSLTHYRTSTQITTSYISLATRKGKKPLKKWQNETVYMEFDDVSEDYTEDRYTGTTEHSTGPNALPIRRRTFLR